MISTRTACRTLFAALLVLVGPAVAPAPSRAADQPVCALYCDTRDPSLARQETLTTQLLNGRRLTLHVSDLDGMAWGSIDDATQGNAVWLDRSFDGGATWDGLLGKASVPATWTGTRTLMYNVSDPSHHRRGVIRACGDANAIGCTPWVHAQVCAPTCDNASGGIDAQPVSEVTLSGRLIGLHLDAAGMAWGTITNGRTGDEVWLDRSFDSGASWPGGSSLGRTTSLRTNRFNVTDPASLLYGGAVRACGRAVEGQNGACTPWTRPSSNNRIAGDTAWLNRATTGWTWFNTSGMINSSGLVNDGLTSSCANNGGTVWTYNQGLAIGAAVELWRATGSSSYLDAARRLGTAALNSSLIRSGTLTESCDLPGAACDDNQKQFKGILMRYLVEVGQFQQFANSQAATLWAGRDTLNQVSSNWAHPELATRDWRTEASALAALLVAQS